MARINSSARRPKVYTHEGGRAVAIPPYQALRRSLLACFLWEDQFYEDGQSIADRITDLASQCTTEQIAELAIEARHEAKLRHAPLWLLIELIKRGGAIVGDTIARVISRADEITELLALYWKDGKKPLSKQLKIGLGRALNKFDAYQLAKYNRDTAIKLRDVIFMVHPKAKSPEQQKLFDAIVDGTLEAPDTWERNLSEGGDKRETFTRLLSENKLGYLALLRNLRNMDQAGVDRKLIEEALLNGNSSRVLPFRFTAAARAVPSLEPVLDKALVKTIESTPKLPGKTIVLVDVSGSMSWSNVSEKSDLTRMDAAATLASVINAEDLRVFTFSNSVAEVPPRRGMAGVDAVIKSQPHGGTHLAGALEVVNNIKHDRLIVITDEQVADSRLPNPTADKVYMINVASYENGIGYGRYTHITGFSEKIIEFIAKVESEDDPAQ